MLTVRPSQMLECEGQLIGRFPELERVSLDRLLLETLRAKAAEDGIDWQVIREADGAPPGSEDHAHLCDLVAEVVPAVEAVLLARERPVLLVHPGLLARYDRMDLLTRLRDRVGRKGTCPGLWVLVAADEQSELPLIDGHEVPLIGSGQRARVPAGLDQQPAPRGDDGNSLMSTTTGTIDTAALLPDLQRLVKDLHADLLERVREHPEIDARLRADAFAPVEKGGRTAQAYEVWRDDYLEQVAVAWVLACVFVRYMEDNDLIAGSYLAGAGDRRRQAEDAHEAYFRAHPRDSDREYLLDVFRRVRSIPAAADLFAEGKTPLWALGPSGDGAARLLAFWRKIDPETGTLVRSFRAEGGGTRFLGDLYQDLSESARKKYALLQTPDFVEEFILDHTLTPALDEFGLEATRLIDPTCGSGHFLLGAFRRLFRLWAEREPGTEPAVLAQRALDAVYGVDVNPFAVAIARFRLVVEAMGLCGVPRLDKAPGWTVHVAFGDSLMHGDTFDRRGFRQEWLPGSEPWSDPLYALEDPAGLGAILNRQYHAVVGNPPYITVKDATLNARYRTAGRPATGSIRSACRSPSGSSTSPSPVTTADRPGSSG